MKKILAMILSLLGLTAGACGRENPYTDLGPEAFAKYLEAGGVQLVDVRTPEEYAEDHIPDAENINVQSDGFMAAADKALDKSRPVAVYCRSGKRSADAAGQLSKAGFKVVNLDGGILAWKKEDLPLVK